MSDAAESWHRAAQALRLLLAAAPGLGGAVIRMRAGPARDAMLGALSPLGCRRIHPGIAQEQLLGGLDLAATMETGKPAYSQGLLHGAPNLVLTMAERTPPLLAALLAQQLDKAPATTLVALDEGADPDERLPLALADRLAFHIAPEGRMPAGWPGPMEAGATAEISAVAASDADIDALTELAVRCGIDSLRAPVLALRAAKAHALCAGRAALAQEDLACAAELVYAHRATQLPEPDEAEHETTDPPPPDSQEGADEREGDSLPEGDILVEAVRAALPDGLLAGLAATGRTKGGGSGAGQKRKGNRKGRPLPSRPGRLDGQNRIDIVATLRAAAPWQALRRGTAPAGNGLAIRPSDIRVRRYEEQSDRLLIFTVDASGSAALARLNEAKGAVETLLAQAYAARDHVALIVFRGSDAELLLPPTRSLVQTKRRLTSLPGGGGTPLAAGLHQALLLARQSRARGLSPTVVLLTDGRGNIALDGRADRTQAAKDAEAMAHALTAEGIGALVIDMSARPQAALRALSDTMRAPYIALPRADAQRLSSAVNAALAG